MAKITTIESTQNPLVKHVVKIREEKSTREENREVLVVGKTLVYELKDKLQVKYIFTEEATPFSTHVVSSSVMKKITGVKSPDGFAMLVSMPKLPIPSSPKRVLLLDRLQDPGNVGTLFRTALAFGFDLIQCIDSVDPFNEKALAASKGAVFFLPFQKNCALDEKRVYLTADVNGEDIAKVELKPPYGLILGHEGKGVSETLKAVSTLTSIPMENGVDSLNVASAGAILLYMLRKQEGGAL